MRKKEELKTERKTVLMTKSLMENIEQEAVRRGIMSNILNHADQSLILVFEAAVLQNSINISAVHKVIQGVKMH